MNRSNKSKIAVTLLSALTFGANDASAVNSSMNSNMNTKSADKSGFSTEKNSKSGAEIPKPLGTLNIRNDSSGNGIFNWVKNHKAVSVAVPLVVVAGAVGLTIWGVKHKSKDNKDSKKGPPSEQGNNPPMGSWLKKQGNNPVVAEKPVSVLPTGKLYAESNRTLITDAVKGFAYLLDFNEEDIALFVDNLFVILAPEELATGANEVLNPVFKVFRGEGKLNGFNLLTVENDTCYLVIRTFDKEGKLRNYLIDVSKNDPIIALEKNLNSIDYSKIDSKGVICMNKADFIKNFEYKITLKAKN